VIQEINQEKSRKIKKNKNEQWFGLLSSKLGAPLLLSGVGTLAIRPLCTLFVH